MGLFYSVLIPGAYTVPGTQSELTQCLTGEEVKE